VAAGAPARVYGIGARRVPRICKDMDYPAKQHLQVFDRDGRRVDPATVDWPQYTVAKRPYRIHWMPPQLRIKIG